LLRATVGDPHISVVENVAKACNQRMPRFSWGSWPGGGENARYQSASSQDQHGQRNCPLLSRYEQGGERCLRRSEIRASSKTPGHRRRPKSKFALNSFQSINHIYSPGKKLCSTYYTVANHPDVALLSCTTRLLEVAAPSWLTKYCWALSRASQDKDIVIQLLICRTTRPCGLAIQQE